MDNYTIALFVFLLFVLLFNYREYKYLNGSGYTAKEKKALSLLQVFIFIGITLRVVYLSYPFDLFPDEAIGGYDAWCLVNYGVDQHLASYPVYFKSWGSGQSAFYAYLAFPFIKLFGLSAPVFRLPMALFSCISILALYWSFRKTKQNSNITFLFVIFVIISPWHLMKSRWALDCNIFPELFVIGLSFLLVACYAVSQRKQTGYYLLAFLFIALSAYGYGISWFMLPFFCIMIAVLLYKKRKISLFQIAGCMLLILVVTLPLILFAKLLFFGGEQYELGPITITKLEAGRHDATTLLGRSDWLRTMLSHARKAFVLLFFGEDFLRWNSFPLWGQYYNLLAIPFLIIYAKEVYRERKKLPLIDIFFLIWMLANIPIIVLVEPNVNHWNSLWFPLIYFSARGIGVYLKRSASIKKARIAYITMLSLFAGFCIQYYTYYTLFPVASFFKGVHQPIHFVKGLDVDRIYYSRVYYVYGLFYNPIDPYTFNAKEKYVKNVGIQIIPSYEKHYFYLPESVRPEKGTAYVIENIKLKDLDVDSFNVWSGSEYSVLWNKKTE